MNTSNGKQWRYHYTIADHLGNTRVEFVAHDGAQPEVVQASSYYPFGMTLRRNDYGSRNVNKRLYGGKELQDQTLAGIALNWYDFEARMYDPTIGRFLQTDPKEEKYFNVSPYTYCLNNPILIMDPMGDTVKYADDMTKETIKALIEKAKEKKEDFSRKFKKKFLKLDKSETTYTFRLTNDFPKGVNGQVKAVDNGYEIQFSQNRGVRVTDELGGFSPKYAALFEETYHAVDIEEGKFKIGEQTAMDEARAWQFAAQAPGTRYYLNNGSFNGHTAAATCKDASVGWVAKMLKEGQYDKENSPFKDSYDFGTINKAYKNLEEGDGYGLSFHRVDNQFLNFQYKDTCELVINPSKLTRNCSGTLVYKGHRKQLYTGILVGKLNNNDSRKFRQKDYRVFSSYYYLCHLSGFYELGMLINRNVVMKGMCIRGLEEGKFQYTYSDEDKEFQFITATYKNGKLNGTAKYYKPDGRLYQEVDFKDGKLDGYFIWYNEAGEIIYRDTYKDDKLIKTEQFAEDPRGFD